MRNKKVFRLTESQLHNIIAESVNRVLNEGIEEGAVTNGLRNIAGRAYGAYQGAKTGYNYGAGIAKAENQHDKRMKNGVEYGNSLIQRDEDRENHKLDAILNFIERMGITYDKELANKLSARFKEMYPFREF